jgi:chitinase
MQCVASYSYDPRTREYVTYDSPEVVNAKCRYIADRQLAGAMFWELSADQPPNTPRSLIQTVYNGFGGRVDQIPNHLEYPNSQYENIRRQMQ